MLLFPIGAAAIVDLGQAQVGSGTGDFYVMIPGRLIKLGEKRNFGADRCRLALADHAGGPVLHLAAGDVLKASACAELLDNAVGQPPVSVLRGCGAFSSDGGKN